MSKELAQLNLLAELYGVELDYVDYFGKRVVADTDSLLHVLQARGAPVTRVTDAGDALRFRHEQLAGAGLAPVHVAWDGEAVVPLQGGDVGPGGSVAWLLRLEDGETREGVVDVGRAWKLNELPFGVHELQLVTGARSRLLAAPRRAARPHPDRPTWGVTIPLYALHSRSSDGAGNLWELRELRNWVGKLGGAVVGLLPLHPTFLDRPFDPSPYAPVSRRYWNELYADCNSAGRDLLGPSWRGSEPGDLAWNREGPIDYRALGRSRARALDRLTREIYTASDAAVRELERYVEQRPGLRDYACFRVETERRGCGWRSWPQPARSGDLREEELDPWRVRRELVGQWLVERQLGIASDDAKSAGLYLDLPLGVHPDGYDTWRERSCFADGVSVGAPPDDFFHDGQDWGSPPLHPERCRPDSHRYFRECVSHSTRHAALLRIDHVMGLHRQYWIPAGADARHGVYVRYPVEELYAVLCLESWRSGCGIVGEDLGTLPDDVRPTMDRHDVLGCHVLPFAVDPETAEVAPAGKRQVASLGTHDTATFAGFWEQRDLDELERLAVADAAWLAEQRRRREQVKAALVSYLEREGSLDPADRDRPAALLEAALELLARGDAPLMLINLEDLWLEPEPQNVPGTHGLRPNWQRRAQLPLEEFSAAPELTALLEKLDRLRRTARGVSG